MLDLLTTFIPSPLTPGATLILLAVSAATSFLTTAFGLGGGAVLIGVMAMFMPPGIVIPVHGVIQIGSIVGRISVMWQHVVWPVLLAFAVGGAIGSAVGAQLLVELPEGWMELMLGAFILWSCYGRMPRLRQGSPLGIGVSGAVTSGLSLFVGVTGPLVGALLKGMRFDRLSHVATFSACMFTQQGFKILVFGLLGFAYGPYVPFMAAMIVCGFIGTLLGKKLLLRMNDRIFGFILTLILTVLGLRLMYSGSVSLVN